MATATSSNGKAPVVPTPKTSAWDIKLAAERINRTAETRPANKTEAELRGGYTGPMHDQASQNCLNCLGDGYFKGAYCPCMFNALAYERYLHGAQSASPRKG